MKKITLLLSLLLSGITYSQTPVNLFALNDFESGTDLSYLYSPGITANTWHISTCAGNGNTVAGSNALYITKGGTDPGCGATGQDQYAMVAASPSGNEKVTAYVSLNGNCSNNHTITFDYKLNMTNPNNKAYVVYSLNSGAFWFKQDTLANASDWTNITVSLDESTFNTLFFVGIQFEYDDGPTAGSTIAIDNFRVDGIKAEANIAIDTLALCGQNSTLISADDFYAGSGTWSVLSGSGLFNNLTSPQTGVNNIGIDTNVFMWTVTSPNCGNSSDTIVVINSSAPSNANVQDTFMACATSSLSISTSQPISGVGMWSSPDGVVFADVMSPATTAANFQNGWNELIWTISTPGCASSSDTMNVFITGNQLILSQDTSLCFGEDHTLQVISTSIDSLQTTSWYFASGSASITTISEDTIELTDITTGENLLIYEVTHDFCPTAEDTMLIIVTPCGELDPIFPTVITPNGDGENDLFEIYNLEKLYPGCHIVIFNRAGSVVFESDGYAEPWDGTYKGEKLPMGAYYYRLDLNDGSGKSFDGSISIIH